MIISQDDQLRIINGERSFRSAFTNKNRRTRYRAHRKLQEALHERGYYPNGIKPPEHVLPALDPSKLICKEDINAFYGSMLTSIEALTEQVKNFDKRESTTHFINPDTGQSIPLECIMGATLLWPLEEVMELVP